MTTHDSFVTPITKIMTTSIPTPTTYLNQGTGSGNSSTSTQALRDTTHNLQGPRDDQEPRRLQPSPPPPPKLWIVRVEAVDVLPSIARLAVDDKYSGEEDDFFRPKQKLDKFRENCTRWEVTEEAKAKLFPLMLTDKAAEYHTRTISPNRPGINDMIAQIQANFETEAKHELFEGQWDEITFHKVVKENPDKSLEQNVSLLVAKLEELFGGSFLPVQRDTKLRNKLKKAMATSGVSQVTQVHRSTTKDIRSYSGRVQELFQGQGTRMRPSRRIQQQCWSRMDAQPISDVTSTALAIVETALDPAGVPATIQPITGGLTWSEIWDLVTDMGYDVKPRPESEWMATVRRDLQREQEKQ
ncbi:hypothetical protein E4U32_001491 [Claviceps aff. humidiphila group G2b]|nr:hypothetical protein E4U32_001491 [Claviceps aff. humidiphila group G2b]